MVLKRSVDFFCCSMKFSLLVVKEVYGTAKASSHLKLDVRTISTEMTKNFMNYCN